MKALMTLVLALLLAGCATRQGDAGRTLAEETTAQIRGGNPRPPDSTLSCGGREVRGSLGSYCWSYDGAQGCFDVGGIPLPHNPQTLTVASGSEMVFRYGGQMPPKKVEAGALPLGKKGGWVLDKRGRIIHHSLKAYGSGVERTIPADLPPGEYAVEVLVMEPQGDASYYFHVMVE